MGGSLSALSGLTNWASTGKHGNTQAKKRKNDNQMILYEGELGIVGAKRMRMQEPMKEIEMIEIIEKGISSIKDSDKSEELANLYRNAAIESNRRRGPQIQPVAYELRLTEEIVMRNRNGTPVDEYTLDPKSIQYNVNSEDMVQQIKNGARKIKFSNMKSLIAAEKLIRKRIANDEELRSYYVRSFSEIIDYSVMMTKAQSIHMVLLDQKSTFKSTARENKNVKRRKFLEYALDNSLTLSYVPPIDRVLLMSNLTTNLHDTIPVFCDISIEAENVEVPRSLAYKYLNRSVCPSLERLEKKIEQKKNIIKCDCCSEQPIVPCWMNENCECYRMNLKLREFQEGANKKHMDALAEARATDEMKNQKKDGRNDEKYYHETTNFATFKPILLNTNHFFNAIGFACSELCECKGRCTNNVTLLPEKKLNSFEVYRRDEHLGHGVRTLNAIRAGTPVDEFTGETTKHTEVKKEDYDYAFCVVDEDEQFAKIVSEFKEEWSTSFKEELVAALKTKWDVNPKWKGNVARTFNHSCQSNLDIVRVFQKGFSPSHIRFLVVTTEDIYPGVELTLNYGEEYLRKNFDKCLCNTITCKDTKAIRNLKPWSFEEVQSFCALGHHVQHKIYEESVLNRLE